MQGYKEWDDVNSYSNVANISDPIGGVQDEGVIYAVGLHLNVLDVPLVNVLLVKCLDRGLFASDIALLGLDKAPEKAMRWSNLDCEHDLRWQVVLMGDLSQSRNTPWLHLKCHIAFEILILINIVSKA